MSRVVLLVDDDPLVLDVAASMLEDIGCEVVTAAGGAEALEKLSRDERIEILITDVNMPGIDGYALAKYATQTRESLKVINCPDERAMVPAIHLSVSRSCKTI
jgi:CheY-like chemotaxis protein